MCLRASLGSLANTLHICWCMYGCTSVCVRVSVFMNLVQRVELGIVVHLKYKLIGKNQPQFHSAKTNIWLRGNGWKHKHRREREEW